MLPPLFAVIYSSSIHAAAMFTNFAFDPAGRGVLGFNMKVLSTIPEPGIGKG